MRKEITYRWEILAVFSFIEVLLYNTNPFLQAVIAIGEYVFLGVVFAKNKGIGILYFLSFTLLTLGWGNYFGREMEVYNFWGLRAGPFSLNILFSVLLCFGVLIRKKWKINIPWNPIHVFFIFFILYSCVIGGIYTWAGVNYADNFTEDFMTYFSYPLYVVLLAEVSVVSLLRLLKYVTGLTVGMLVLSFVLDKKSIYADGYFLLSNALYFILPVMVVLFKDLYNRKLWLAMVVLVYIFMALGEYFIAGKTVILLLFWLVWLGWSRRSVRYFLFFPFLFLAFNLQEILNWFATFFEGNIIAYKFSQISEIFTYIDLNTIASLPSSMGNLVAEGLTIYGATQEHWVYYLLGGGFGAAVPDIYGYLSPWSSMGGYRAIDAVRGSFHKMHLPVFEIFLKGGLFFLTYYIWVIMRVWKTRNIYLFIFGLMFFFTFYVSKEMFLLTLILLKVSSIPETQKEVSLTEEKLLL